VFVGFEGLLLSIAHALLTHPAALIQALVLACRMGCRADRPLFVHLIYLAEACRIESCYITPVSNLHAHFSTNSAEVAMLVHPLGRPDWSFTVLGPEEFDNPQFTGSGEKIRRCSFVVAISSFMRSQLHRWAEHQY
jgi:colanic acid/amylovoran biosynthesis glycosyltransferase